MRKNIKKFSVAMLVLGMSLTANAQNWNLNGNNSSNTFEKIGLKDPVDLQFLTDDKVRLSLTQNGWLGLGTLNPEGWQEIFYTPTTSTGDNGLLVTLNSSNPNGITYNVLTPDKIGGGLFEVYNPGSGEGTGGTSNPTFTVPFSFRTGHLTNIATPLYSQNTKPMFWVREKNPPNLNSATGLEEFHTKFIVMPDGSCGINITNPRAALDVRGSQAPNRPAAIIGSRAIGTNLNDPNTQLDQYYTQMVQFVPVLKENGYNQIVQKDDQGMFFTDGLGVEGANGAGAFILAPWAASGDTAVGGLRMDKFGNTEFHGTLRSTRVKVDAKWWSDFVFADDYKLLSLAEVEAFILANKHLPNVPSEAEVLENGIDVANMQAIQQQKIEELTLYIIQMQKQMDVMQAEMELLKQ
jgi:hypothetical protein